MLRTTHIFILFILLISFDLTAQSKQEIIITLSVAQGAPTVDQVYGEGQLAPPPQNYLLESFDQFPPLKVDYIKKIRAFGELEKFIQANPDWGRSKMERSLILSYSDKTNIDEIETALTNDKFISSVTRIYNPQLATRNDKASVETQFRGGLDPNWHLNAVNWPAAQLLTNGFGHVGTIDVGTIPDRSEFAQFDISNGTYTGGRLANSQSFATFYDDRSVSEVRELDEDTLSGGAGNCDTFDQNPNDGFVFPEIKFTGHGTHVTGLIVGKGSTVSGVCKDCNLAASLEAEHRCVTVDANANIYEVEPIINLNRWTDPLAYYIETGRQTINMSFNSFTLNSDLCVALPNNLGCILIADAVARNILIVSAAGNFRTEMAFPAYDRRVIGVSGIQQDLQFWNESPTNGQNFPPADPNALQDTSNCPFAGTSNPNVECGSNFSRIDEVSPGVFEAERFRRIDVASPAKDVFSTLPLGSEYNSFIGCTDDADGLVDGIGPCTGTSMSTPIVSGIVQIIRSVNPLLPNGDDDPSTVEGVRDTLLHTASEYQTNREHNIWLGFGIPNVAKAVELVLGVSNGQQVRNRVTPLFSLENSSLNDTAYTAFPQIALSYGLNPSGFYTPTSDPAVSELTSFPVENVNGQPIITLNTTSPFYVFTTPWNPQSQTDSLIPLYRMVKQQVSPANCFPGIDQGCTVTSRDTVMVTDTVELETFNQQGYALKGIEGYLFPCVTENCEPPSAIKVHRIYDSNADNHYLSLFPPINGEPFVILGAVYGNVDGDQDGLSTGMEILLGTSDQNADTDGDGINDVDEYPPAGIPFSDPLISDIIFENGFE
ncbi:S8 family serine peptidase [Marinicella sp. W31]|uniref:S8 family serine peptidase n=1 Tax=Marinicella sp. W31 TaxID=3023713 RepID=UPI0037566F64